MTTSLETKICQAVATVISTSGGTFTEITPATSLMDSGLIDSFSILEVIEHLEATYNITLSNDDLIPANFETVSAMVALVRKSGGDTLAL